MVEAKTAQNTFGLKLIADLTATAYRQKNVFVSPSSVYLALGMAELGAAGATRAEIRGALQVPANWTEEELHASVSALSQSLRSREGIELSIANALWADHRTTLSAEFVAHCRQLYEAEANTLDFQRPDTAEVINNWVKRETRDKIEGIVSRSSVAASKAILTNAVYFKGKWQSPFEKVLTQDGPFHRVNGGTKQVPFMRHRVILDAYRSGDGYEGVALPYGTSGVEMCVLLAAPGKTPEEVLSGFQVAPFLNGYQPVELDLRLPRFALAFDASVKDALQRMGMKSAFRYGAADFKPLGSPQFFIGDILHRTVLEVDEMGTVAAAVTAIAMPTGAAVPRKMQKKVLVVDRPFALLLCDRRTGTILFAGVVYEP